MDARAIIGRNIARIRAANGLSQTQLAALIDPSQSRMGQTYISKIENGRKNISILLLAIIADALRVQMVDLVALDEAMPRSDLRAGSNHIKKTKR